MLHLDLYLVYQNLQLECQQQCQTSGIPLTNLSIYFWNMSSASPTQNCNCVYLYLPNGEGIVVKYDNCSSHFSLWQPKYASIGARYLTTASLSRISFNSGHLCTGLINTLLSMAGSKHKHTLPLTFRNGTQLLHQSDVSLTPEVI